VGGDVESPTHRKASRLVRGLVEVEGWKIGRFLGEPEIPLLNKFVLLISLHLY
jgi:hypothetical protein